MFATIKTIVSRFELCLNAVKGRQGNWLEAWDFEVFGVANPTQREWSCKDCRVGKAIYSSVCSCIVTCSLNMKSLLKNCWFLFKIMTNSSKLKYMRIIKSFPYKCHQSGLVTMQEKRFVLLQKWNIYEVVLREQRNAFFIVASAKRRRRRNNQSYIETKRASGMELKELSVISQSKETNTNDFASLSTSPPRSTERFAEVKGGEANNTEKRH